MIRIHVQRCGCGNSDPRKFLEDDEQGELICEGCGRVTQLKIDDPKPTTTTEETLGSIIDPLFNHNSNEFIASLRRVGNHVLPNYSEVVWRKLVEDLSGRAGIPQHVRESVIQYYRSNRENLKNLNRREVATALLYVHMKNYMKNHRSLKEICEKAGANPIRTRKYLSILEFEHGLKPIYRPPEEYVSIFGTKMNLDQDIVSRGLEFARKYHESAFSCATPRTVAASAVYLATRENGHQYTQREVAEACGLAEYTVREVSARMKKFLRSYNGTG